MQNAHSCFPECCLISLPSDNKGMAEHQHRGLILNQPGLSLECVCAAQYGPAGSQEQGAELFVQHHVSKTKLHLLMCRAPDMLTRSCVTMCQLRV